MTRRTLIASVVAAAPLAASNPKPLHAVVREAATRAESEGQYDAAMILGGLSRFLADPSRGSLDMRSFETQNHLIVAMNLQAQTGGKTGR
jgi:hypothetical protein